MFNKKAMAGKNLIEIMVLLLVAAALITPVVLAVGNFSAASPVLGSLFSSTGVVMILIVVGLFYTVYKMAMHKGK